MITVQLEIPLAFRGSRLIPHNIMCASFINFITIRL